MSLAIKLNGAIYTSFVAARVSKSIDTLTGAFSFVSTATADNLFPARVGDAVKIVADEQDLLTGYVERLTINYGVDNHTIEVSGRGKLADLIDSSVKSTKEFTGGIFLVTIAETILQDLGITSSVINNAGTVEVFTEDDIISADVGQPAFEFLETYAQKRQVFLNENEDGDLVLSRGSTGQAPIVLTNVLGGNFNNVKSASLDLNNSGRYNQYVVRSQLNPIFQLLSTLPNNVVDQSGSSTDTSIRSTRFLELNSDQSANSDDAENIAVWETNVRRARSLNYTAVVFGHTFCGSLIEPNTLITVRDNFCDIDSDLLVRSVDYNYDLQNGSTTTIACAPKDAYTLEAEQAQRDANTTDQAEGLLL